MLALLALACSNAVDFGDTAGDGGGTTDAYEYRGPEPVIFEADAVCKGSTWYLGCRAGDQQGKDTIASGLVVIFRHGDGLHLGDAPTACKDGLCTGTTPEDPENLSCTIPGEYKFQFWVTDEDGNESRALEVQGRTKQ
jgi:hypothetical protein